jgi:hypothetical protein
VFEFLVFLGQFCNVLDAVKGCAIELRIVKRVYYEEEGLGPGDTLFVKLQAFKKGTVTCNATAYNRTFSFRLLKDMIEKKK